MIKMQSIISCFLLFISIHFIYGQQKSIDSLQQKIAITNISDENYPLYQAQLAEATRYITIEKSKELIEKSILLIGQSNNPILKSKIYGMATIIYRQNNDYSKMIEAVGKSIYFANVSNDNYAKGYANYCKSLSMESIGNDTELAYYFQALKYTESTKDAVLLSKIYYGIYGFYAIHNNLVLEKKYANLCLQEALKTSDGEVLSKAWQACGTNFSDQYAATKSKSLLDSSLIAFRNGIKEFQKRKQYIIPQTQYGVLALNTAVNYYVNFMPKRKDSVYFYVNKALESAIINKYVDMEVNCYGLLSELAYQDNDYETVQNLLTKALTNAKNQKTEQPALLAKIYYGLSQLYNKKNDFKQAFVYQEKYVNEYNKYIANEQQKNIQLLDAKYDFRKKTEQIKLLNEKNKLSSRQKYFSFGIAILLFVSLLFMFISYNYRLKFSIEQQNLLKAKAEESKLIAQLLEEKAKLKTEEATRLQMEQKLIIAQKKQLEKELIAGNLQVEHKYEVLQNMKEKLFLQGNNIETIQNLTRIINEEIRLDKDFDVIKNDFKDIQPEFIEKLHQQSNQKLTSLELKYCTYVKLNLSTKQMSTILHVETSTIRMNKYRLKQKLNLKKNDNLYDFLCSL
jgi:DNA-binding CsgD family transcriptional regulator